jgi:hypothetical protein
MLQNDNTNITKKYVLQILSTCDAIKIVALLLLKEKLLRYTRNTYYLIPI